VATDIEVRAAAVAASLVGDDDLMRVCQQDGPACKPDFRSCHNAVEVKELVSQNFRAFTQASERYIRDDRFHSVPALRHARGVIPDVSYAASSFSPRARTPTVKTLVEKLTPLLERLEERRLTDARIDHEIWPSIASVIHTGHCSVIPNAPWGPGIVLMGHGYGIARTTKPEDDVVGFLQRWLDSNQAENLRWSLKPEKPLRRIAVLVASFHGPASAMIHTLMENPPDSSAPLRNALTLPSEIDTLIVIAEGQVLDYGLVGAVWRRHRLEAIPGLDIG
jgi:hypothetical protein